jgi:hypothetical protein
MEKWGVGVLGVVSLAMIVHLVFQLKQMGVKPSGMKRSVMKTPSHAKASGPAGAKAATGKLPGKLKIPNELSRYNSLVELDLLKQFEDRPLPELKRNPFDFVTAPVPARREQGPGAAPAPVQPPPPPPVTLKVMGYSEGVGGVQEAMVSDEDQVFVVHAGDSVGTRYKVIKITPTAVTVEDATIHQTVDLPVPQ